MNETLSTRYKKFKEENPKVRIRDAARKLGVSEVELVALNDSNRRLQPEFVALLNEIPALGRVMALTRNEHAVHERKGTYNPAEFEGKMGQVVGPDIDLRLFLYTWKFAFAVSENGKNSIQFFAKDGSAIHKIYLTPESDVDAFEAIATKYRMEDPDADWEVEASSAPVAPAIKEGVDKSAFQQDWLALENTHQFFPMLRKFGVGRLQALQLAPAGYAQTIGMDDVKRVLQHAADAEIDIMVFIGNKGCIQIHSGKVKNLVQAGNWYNVLDPDFNMHLNEEGISSIWIVKKPTANGLVSSIEILDASGEIIVQFFGKRKAGEQEPEEWRKALS